LRLNKKLSQKAFGSEVGVSDSAISQIEKGKVHPSDALVVAVCLRWNVNKGWLTTSKGEMFASGKQAADDRQEEKGADQLRYASGAFAGWPPDLHTFLDQVQEIMTSDEETIKMALRVNVIAFHQAVKNQKEITALKSKISNHGHDIDELKKAISQNDHDTKEKEK
jgi:transcriptional regulator with XRE-family HTH domain